VKVYRKADPSDNKKGMVFDSNLPVLFNDDGHKIKP